MNVKIKSAGVVNVLGTDYDRIYSSLKERLTAPDEQLFTPRIPGHEYLQWDMPDEDWTPLSKADPVMEALVKEEFDKRKKKIETRFGNKILADKILSVPDDSYVFFRVNPDGTLDIKLTAWGYKFPERVGNTVASGYAGAHQKKVPVKVIVISDGDPVSHKELFINNLRRFTNEQGEFPVGLLPVGYQFTLKIEDKEEIITVSPQSENIVIDITPPAPEKEILTPEEEEISEELEEDDNNSEEIKEDVQEEEEEKEITKGDEEDVTGEEEEPEEKEEEEEEEEEEKPETPEPAKEKYSLWSDILGILALILMIGGTYIGCYYILF